MPEFRLGKLLGNVGCGCMAVLFIFLGFSLILAPVGDRPQQKDERWHYDEDGQVAQKPVEETDDVDGILGFALLVIWLVIFLVSLCGIIRNLIPRWRRPRF